MFKVRPHISRFICCCCVAVLVFASGCGEENTSSATLTREQFLNRAEHICSRAAKKQFDTVQRALQASNNNGNGDLEQLTLEVILPAASKMTRDLTRLRPPMELESQAERLVAELKAGLKRAQATPKSFLAGDAFQQADLAAKELGLTKCRI